MGPAKRAALLRHLLCKHHLYFIDWKEEGEEEISSPSEHDEAKNP